jgi:ClpP class serine protease
VEKVQELIWLWTILALTVIPALRQWMAAVRRQLLIRSIERQRGTKVITMIHRQGAGLLGTLFARYINLDDGEQIMKAIARAGSKPIDLVLHTPGGLVIAAEQIARVLHAHPGGVTVIVPQYAMSGGTMLALAADQILMDRHAMLGPVDPQLNGFPAGSYLRVLQEKEKNAIQDDTLIMADIAEKAVRQVQRTVAELLRRKLGEARANQVATMLTDGRWTHDYPLHVEELQAMGLPVSSAIPPEFWELLGLSGAAQPKLVQKAGKSGPARQ